MISFKFN